MSGLKREFSRESTRQKLTKKADFSKVKLSTTIDRNKNDAGMKQRTREPTTYTVVFKIGRAHV